MNDFGEKVKPIWSVADRLRGPAVGTPNHIYIHYLTVVFPSPNDQQAIVTLLDHGKDRIDRPIEAIRRSSDMLRESRSALISAAVAGKIDVREEVA